MSRLSDLYGRRMIYILDVILFAIGSLIIALSPTFSIVLLGRAIQGFGVGGIFPVASAVIGDTFPVEKRGSALGFNWCRVWNCLYHRSHSGGHHFINRHLEVAIHYQPADRTGCSDSGIKNTTCYPAGSTR